MKNYLWLCIPLMPALCFGRQVKARLLTVCVFTAAFFLSPLLWERGWEWHCGEASAQSIWATYYGGIGDDFSTNSIATDASGNVYLEGYTTSTAGIASGGFQNIFGGGYCDAFLVKFDSNGNRLWATYYGGTGSDTGESVGTDASGNVYMVVATWSPTGIASGGFQNMFLGGGDASLVKFNSSGSRLWATYYGGTAYEVGQSVTTDISGNVYMAGQTTSVSGIASNGFQNTVGGGNDAFLVKFAPNGSRLWSTYYGGAGVDVGLSVTTDVSGNVYMAGKTASVSGIASGGFQNTYGGVQDAFLVKFNSSGNRLWSTYYGGTAYELGQSIVTDASANVYLAGTTASPSGIASGGFQNTLGGAGFLPWDAFLVKFDTGGSRLWATYYGGTDIESAWSIDIDRNNNIYMLMEAEEAATPALVDACSYQPVYGGVEDQIIVKFSPAGQKLCATYMGGTGEDELETGGGITVYGNVLYITASTNGGYPVTPGVFQTTYGGGTYDAFVASLCTNICEGKVLGLDYTASTATVCAASPVTFTPSVANSCDTTGYKFHWTFTGANPASSDSVKPTITYPSAGTYTITLVLTTVCKKDSIKKTITVIPCLLPVELLYFTATAENTSLVRCQWSTASEINSDYFAVERGKDGITFSQLGTVKGAGNSSIIRNYEFIDAQLPSPVGEGLGVRYYRLRQVDLNSKYEYSPIRTVYIGTSEIISIYPNPSMDGYIQYFVASTAGGEVSIKVYDVLGREVLSRTETLQSGVSTNELSTAALSSGSYLLQISTPSQEKTQKQFVVK